MAFGKDFSGNIRVSLDMDSRQAAEFQSFLGEVPGAINRVLVRAINDTTRNGKTIIVRGLADATTAKSRDISKRIEVTRATKDKPFGKIHLRRVLFAAIRFRHREKRKKTGWGTAASGEGVFIETMKGKVVHLAHAFIATGLRFGRAIFQRQHRGPGSTRGGLGRKHLQRTGAVDMGAIFWTTADLGQRVVDRMRDQFGKNIDSRAAFEIAKKAGKK